MNPVRAGMVSDPAKYRGSSYGEVVRLKDVSRIYRRAMGLALGRKTLDAKVGGTGKKTTVSKNDAELLESEDNETMLPDLASGAMLRHLIRYLTPLRFVQAAGSQTVGREA